MLYKKNERINNDEQFVISYIFKVFQYLSKHIGDLTIQKYQFRVFENQILDTASRHSRLRISAIMLTPDSAGRLLTICLYIRQ